jgi:hypothetical protein
MRCAFLQVVSEKECVFRADRRSQPTGNSDGWSETRAWPRSSAVTFKTQLATSIPVGYLLICYACLRCHDYLCQLHLGENEFLDFADARFVTLIEDPLFDPLSANQTRPRQNLQMFARGRLANAQLAGDRQAAHAVREQISIDLRGKMLGWMPEPVQDLEPAFIGERLKSGL